MITTNASVYDIERTGENDFDINMKRLEQFHSELKLYKMCKMIVGIEYSDKKELTAKEISVMLFAHPDGDKLVSWRDNGIGTSYNKTMSNVKKFSKNIKNKIEKVDEIQDIENIKELKYEFNIHIDNTSPFFEVALSDSETREWDENEFEALKEVIDYNPFESFNQR